MSTATALAVFFALFLFAAEIFAQSPDAILATAKDKTLKAADLSPEGQAAYQQWIPSVKAKRSELFEQLVAEELLRLESRALGTSAEDLVAKQRAKVAEPTDAQIRSVFDLNRASLGNRTLEQSRKDISKFLRREPEQKALDAYIAELKTKHKFTAGKSLNDPGISPFDGVATIAGKQITAREFDAKFRFELNDEEHHIYEHVRAEVEEALLNLLMEAEAKERGVTQGEIIAAEITDKSRDYSDEEREKLTTALKTKLFEKYSAKITLKEPPALAREISADGEPFIGPADAPVTIVMFSDFQCPACARTHPVLKRVIAEFPGKVRLVVRDFPLEGIHPHAFNAALAANAAAKQGKFTEFAEVLYTNQDALDDASLRQFAVQVGLNLKQFEIDFTDAKNADEIRQDVADGHIAGVSGTPTIFVNGVKVHSLSAEAFRRSINSAIAK